MGWQVNAVIFHCYTSVSWVASECSNMSLPWKCLCRERESVSYTVMCHSYTSVSVTGVYNTVTLLSKCCMLVDIFYTVRCHSYTSGCKLTTTYNILPQSKWHKMCHAYTKVTGVLLCMCVSVYILASLFNNWVAVVNVHIKATSYERSYKFYQNQ